MFPHLDDFRKLFREFLVERFKKRNDERRAKQLADIVVNALSLTTLAVVAVVIKTTTPPITTKPLDQELRAQEKRLDDVQANLKDLGQFVERQRTEIRGAQEAITAMQKERSELEPVLTATRAQVNAIIKAQAKQLQDEAEKQRWLGVRDGVLGSLIAAALWAFGGSILRFIRSRMKSDLPPPGAPEEEN